MSRSFKISVTTSSGLCTLGIAVSTDITIEEKPERENSMNIVELFIVNTPEQLAYYKNGSGAYATLRDRPFK